MSTLFLVAIIFIICSLFTGFCERTNSLALSQDVPPGYYPLPGSYYIVQNTYLDPECTIQVKVSLYSTGLCYPVLQSNGNVWYANIMMTNYGAQWVHQLYDNNQCSGFNGNIENNLYVPQLNPSCGQISGTNMYQGREYAMLSSIYNQYYTTESNQILYYGWYSDQCNSNAGPYRRDFFNVICLLNSSQVMIFGCNSNLEWVVYQYYNVSNMPICNNDTTARSNLPAFIQELSGYPNTSIIPPSYAPLELKLGECSVSTDNVITYLYMCNLVYEERVVISAGNNIFSQSLLSCFLGVFLSLMITIGTIMLHHY